MAGLEPVKVREMAEALGAAVSPVGVTPSELGSNLVPQLVKPSAQGTANYDFFRRQPKVPEGMQNRPLAAQRFPWTSETAGKIAGALGTSPIKTEEWIKDTLGGMGPQFLRTADTALAATGVIEPKEIKGEGVAGMIGSRFWGARGGEQQGREFGQRRDTEKKALSASYKEIPRWISQEMVRLNTGYGSPQRIEGESDEEYILRQQVTGRVMATALRDQMTASAGNGKTWLTLPRTKEYDELRRGDVQDAIAAARRDVKELTDWMVENEVQPGNRLKMYRTVFEKLAPAR